MKINTGEGNDPCSRVQTQPCEQAVIDATNPKPQTLSPKSQTLSSKSQTLSPKSQTLNTSLHASLVPPNTPATALNVATS